MVRKKGSQTGQAETPESADDAATPTAKETLTEAAREPIGDAQEPGTEDGSTRTGEEDGDPARAEKTPDAPPAEERAPDPVTPDPVTPDGEAERAPVGSHDLGSHDVGPHDDATSASPETEAAKHPEHAPETSGTDPAETPVVETADVEMAREPDLAMREGAETPQTTDGMQERGPETGEAAGEAAREATGEAGRETPVMRTEQVTVRKGGFWSMLFGGALAAGIGVAASPLLFPYIQPFVAPYLPEEQAAPPTDGGALQAEFDRQIEAQAQRIAEIEARLDTRLEARPDPVDPSGEIESLSIALSGLDERVAQIEPRISALEERPATSENFPATLGDRIATLEERIASLEERPAPEMPDSGVTEGDLARLEERLAREAETGIAGLGERLAREAETAIAGLEERLSERLAEQRARIDALRSTLDAEEAVARDSARATLRRAALTRVMTAIDTGEPLGAALDDLRETGMDIPDALVAVAEQGVPTRGALAAEFPDAARDALAASRGTGASSTASVGDFLKAQLGVRSLAPREGDEPDAILSRAEAALSEGRLGDALAEIESLPEEARAALSDWAARAAARRDARAAASALSAELN